MLFTSAPVPFGGKRPLVLLALLACILLCTLPALASDASPCSSRVDPDAPQAVLANDSVQALVYLPDAQRGYYRGSRFDWSGVVGCLAYKGHTFFGVWFPHYDPFLHDAITGPVEEFRSAGGQSAPFYDDALPGRIFVKPGIGVLKRTGDAPFQFSTRYPIVDHGKWTIHARSDSIAFRQKLKPKAGIGYDYTKTLRLSSSEPVLSIEHALTNTGTRTIDTEVYDHDFYMLDDSPTGPAITVRLPFEPTATQDLKNGAHIVGRQIVFDRELNTGESAFTGLTGFSQNVSDYDFIVENSATGAGVEQTADAPIARMFFWSIRTTVCPEAYIHLVVAPGQTAHWTIRYRFFTR
ncbi:MAG TPA: hypothetical protein VHD85_08315 [Terracidiphilus sp.]|nr:hypothetical protein [Terracidiphilus sp.]